MFITPFLKVKKFFLRSFCRKILLLCTVSIQERFMMAHVLHIKNIRIKKLFQVVDSSQGKSKRSIILFLCTLAIWPFFRYCIKWKKSRFFSQDILTSERFLILSMPFLNLTGWLSRHFLKFPQISPAFLIHNRILCVIQNIVKCLWHF